MQIKLSSFNSLILIISLRFHECSEHAPLRFHQHARLSNLRDLTGIHDHGVFEVEDGLHKAIRSGVDAKGSNINYGVT